jgi:ribosomal-protein-alanine N-acetyltransferase
VTDFYQRNGAHLAPWEPPKPEGFHTEAFQRERLVKAEGEAAADSAVRWWLSLREQPDILVGSIGLTGIARGPFQNAMLGYALDGQLQGQGLMHEALEAVIEHAFSPAMGLHRIQANVRPENLRSRHLLEKLHFDHEGFARDYLYIDGAWRDHLMFALRNERFNGIPT